ncbi:MAG: Hcp family type VI secretion system effector [Steroidobacteraceae bacterium]
MSASDMFLKVQGITGEASDDKHKGEIDIVSWSWGIHGNLDRGVPAGKAQYRDLQIVKKIDRASPTLMAYLSTYKVADQAVLTVRKAGTNPLEYLKIELKEVRIRTLDLESHGTDVVERLALGFTWVTVSYVPQGSTGAVGGGGVTFTAQVAPG